MRYKKSLIFSFIIFTLILGLFNVSSVKAALGDITYNFNDDILFTSSELGRQSDTDNSSNTFNVREREQITGHFNATYSFENDDYGSEPNGFVSSNTGISTTTIQDYKGHDKVLQFNDSNGVDVCQVDQVLPVQILNQTIEFWFLKDDVGSPTTIYMYWFEDSFSGANIRPELIFIDNDVFYYTDSNQLIKADYNIANVWFHYKLILDNFTSTFDFYINNILEGDNLPYRSNATLGINNFRMLSTTSAILNSYIDAIGYSWSQYNVSRGLRSMTIDEGSYTGVISNSYINDTNYFTLQSDGTPEKLISYFHFIGLPDIPAIDIWLSYYMVCPEGKTISLEREIIPFDTGITINDENVYLATLISLRVDMNEITPYTVLVYYINAIITVNYTVGDNLIPYVNISNNEIYEVDKWQFRHNPFTRTQYVNGSDNPSGWTDYGDNGADDVNTLNIGGNRTVVVHIEENGGLIRNFNGINDTYYNITFNFQINSLDDTDIGLNDITIYIKDSDNSSYLTYLILTYDGNITLYYNEGFSIIGTFDIIESYSVSFFLNLRSQIQNFTMRYYDNQSLLTSFTAPFYENANDIDQILYFHNTTNNEVDTYLMSISIYNTTGSISDDIGEVRFDELASPVIRKDKTWFFSEYNLFNLYGNFINASVFINEAGGLVYRLFLDWTDIINLKNFNIYSEGSYVSSSFSNVRIWTHYNFTFSNITVRGVKLIENSNSYPLIFDYDNVDGNESYFYLDSNSRLRFIHISNDNDLEYIQAEFNIVDVSSQDFAIKFKSTINNMAFGFFRVKFTDISNYFPIEPYETITRMFITQGKTINSLIVLITDDDLRNNGTTEGYVSDIELLFVSGIRVSIITSSLLIIIIPLIIIFIPTFLLSSRLSKNMIVPLMMLMSLICVATEIIPIWLFFVIVFPSSLFLFLKRKELI